MNTKKQSFIALLMVCSLASMCALIVLLGIAPAHAAGSSAPSTAPASPLATTWVVTSSTDSGVGTLRAAMVAAASGDTITFAGDYKIYLSSTLTISKHLTIDGGNRAITLSGDTGNDGSPNVGIFSINSSGVATLTHLSIVSGTAPMPLSGAGGGILNNQGTVTVQNSTLAGNSADYFGGGIMNNQGTVTVRNSTLSGNSAGNGANTTGGGGGIMNNQGTVTVQNSTFSVKVARVNSLGGGIMNNNGTVTVQNSTFSGNSASLAGGGIAHDYSGGVLMSMSNTIIANSSSGGDCYSYNPVTPNNHNLIEDGSCSPFLSGDPLLGSLADNGGPTWTFALLPGSAAIDAGNEAACPATDQRSVARPQGAACDIGAYEVEQYTLKIGVAGNGSGVVTPAIGSHFYLSGTATLVPITATANVGSSFAGWSGNLSGSTNPTSILMDADKIVTATFALQTFTITPTASANGVIAPATPQTVNYSDSITFTLAANTGYHVADVGVDGLSQGPIGSYTFHNVQANHTITAAFALNPPTGLKASNDSPTVLGDMTTLTATVMGGLNVTYQWDFGDGQTGSGALVTHTFASAGHYTALVTATNDAGVLSAATPITITNQLPVANAGTDQTVYAGTLERFPI